MKSVFIAGSRKFYGEIAGLVQTLAENKIRAMTTGKPGNAKKDTFESEKNALLDAFRKIDKADIVYVFAGKGYVGKTVAMEIAYANARKKKIISSEKIEEFSARALVSGVMGTKNFIEYCRK